MTQIVTGFTDPAVAGSAPQAQGAVARPEAWLKELERARWEAQPRYRPGQDADAAALHGEAGGDGAAQENALRTQPQESGAPRAAATVPSRPGDAAIPELPVSTASFIARAAVTPSLFAATPLTPTTEQFRETVLHVLRTQARARTRADAPWSARNVHVQPEAGGWSVWIRDAALTPQQLGPLLQALAQVAADAGDGAPLRLTLNGQPVPGARPDIPPQPAGERHGN
jgi:hypothetical protein